MSIINTLQHSCQIKYYIHWSDYKFTKMGTIQCKIDICSPLMLLIESIFQLILRFVVLHLLWSPFLSAFFLFGLRFLRPFSFKSHLEFLFPQNRIFLPYHSFDFIIFRIIRRKCFLVLIFSQHLSIAWSSTQWRNYVYQTGSFLLIFF